MKRHLNKSLEQQNPIRALGENATKLLSNESIDKIDLISLQLGNPQFKEAGSVSEQMIDAIKSRPAGLGYDSHFGTDKSRREIAEIIERMYKTIEDSYFSITY